MRNWKDIEVNRMRNDAQLWAEFRTDYLNIFGEKIDVNCKRRFYDKYQLLINHLKTKKMAKENSGYKLKPMYNGFWYNGKLYRNETDGFTEIKAVKELQKVHTNWKTLFAVVPKEEPKPAKPTVAERIATIEQALTVEKVKTLLDGEKAKTVLGAGAERIATIEQALKDNE